VVDAFIHVVHAFLYVGATNLYVFAVTSIEKAAGKDWVGVLMNKTFVPGYFFLGLNDDLPLRLLKDHAEGREILKVQKIPKHHCLFKEMI
jgi:hypothetical protein